MGLKKLLKEIQKYFDQADEGVEGSCDRIDELLKKLIKKERRLTSKLQEAKESGQKDKIKSLKMDLKVTRLQIKKGFKRRKELKNKNC